MLKHFDHVTVAVTDIPAAVRLFSLLGFELDKDVMITGPTMERQSSDCGARARRRAARR
jgi:catechol 2,3-dioxygenase-like lactoylglutathione lyase family enzyme